MQQGTKNSKHLDFIELTFEWRKQITDKHRSGGMRGRKWLKVLDR